MIGKESYIDKPKNCYKLGMYYDSENNITYIKMKRVTYFIEMFCALIGIACLLIILLYKSNSVVLECTQIATYYDNTLFLNLRNSDKSEFSVICRIYVNGEFCEERILDSGEMWYNLKTLIYPEDCYIKVYYNSPIIQPMETIRISVVDWSE